MTIMMRILAHTVSHHTRHTQHIYEGEMQGEKSQS